MARTRAVVIDQDNSWTIREELTLDPNNPTAPEDDYTVVNTGFPVYYTATSSYSRIVIWGVGLVSFGPVTPAQTTFMANLGATPDLTAFPGDYAAFGFSSQQLDHFQYGVKNGYVYVTSETSPMVSITPDGLSILGATTPDAYFGMDFGGYTATSTSSALLYFSDLTVTNGTANADTMIGKAGPETLRGLDGNDDLIGNDGGDRLEGGVGSDYLEGNAGNDRLYGGKGADVLWAGHGDDVVNGGAGNDELKGSAGNDVLNGGIGADKYLFTYGLNASTNVDQLVGFNAVDDTIVLDQTVFAQLSTGALAASRYFAGTVAHDADDRIIYDSATGKIYYDADGNGAGAQVVFAQLAAGTALTNADFLIVS